jgi:hypothetical protein
LPTEVGTSPERNLRKARWLAETSGFEPMYSSLHSPTAPRRGIEPLSLHRQWSCDASRITRQESARERTRRGVTDGNRTRLHRVTVCPRHQTSTVTKIVALLRCRGSSWARTTFSRASTERYHSTSSRPVPLAGIEPVVARLKAELPDRGRGALVRDRTGTSRLRDGCSSYRATRASSGRTRPVRDKEFRRRSFTR